MGSPPFCSVACRRGDPIVQLSSRILQNFHRIYTSDLPMLKSSPSKVDNELVKLFRERAA
jgi:hypothetical protein